ncbi:ATP-binding protein [Massilia cavernae]|uniref:ATP-binding protein n=1 Tax=Massilia cavernae TaxID=2320864 RepID=UPI001E3EB8CF|nr:ATP-binding protein [Massilia cavernae]
MLNHPTYDKLTRLKLFGMARAFAEQSGLDLDHLGFDERLGLLIDMKPRNAMARPWRCACNAPSSNECCCEDIDYRMRAALISPCSSAF